MINVQKSDKITVLIRPLFGRKYKYLRRKKQMISLKFAYRLSRRYGAYAASQTTVLHMKRLSRTECLIFVVLCVVCFQR